MISKEVIELLNTHIVFLDIDGTLFEYRYNRHVGANDGTNNGQTVEEINNHIFSQSRPLTSVINTIEKYCKPESTYILGHVRTNGDGLIYGIEIEDKKQLIRENCTFINPLNILFLNDYESKADKIKKICNRLDTKNAVLIDDKIDIIREVENLGYIGLHVSSLVN